MQTTQRRAQIRTFGRADVLRLAALSTKLGADTAAQWSDRFDRNDAVVVGAEIDGVVVGYAAGEIRRSFGRMEAAGWVDAFGVDLSQRGHGLGRQLAAALLDALRALGADHVFTLVPVHDRALGPFFRDLGFRDEALIALGRDL